MSVAASLPIVAATGMVAEAGIAKGHGVVTLAGGGDAARLALMLQAALERGARGVISFGIAGGLAPDLAPGTAVVADAVHVDGERVATDPAWAGRLRALLPQARHGTLAGVDHIVTGPSGKAALLHATGAVAVDMESHVAARLAARYGLPFVALRVIADPAHRALPEAAKVGMRPDGSMDVPAVLRALMRRPHDLSALIRTALDAGAAAATLKRCRRGLPATLGFDEVAPTFVPETLRGTERPRFVSTAKEAPTGNS